MRLGLSFCCPSDERVIDRRPRQLGVPGNKRVSHELCPTRLYRLRLVLQQHVLSSAFLSSLFFSCAGGSSISGEL